MTDYHLVTKEEIGEILENAYDLPIMHDLMEKILTRPDPLEVLEKWAIATHDNLDYAYYDDTVYVSDLQKIIKQLSTNPGAVIKRGKDEGWL